MKKVLLIVAVLLGVAQINFAQLDGSLHDFQGLAWNDANTDQVCGPCHIPHGSDETIAPLWSHDGTSQTGSYTMYDSQTMDSNTGVTDPTGVSALCMGCHDGVTALEAHDQSQEVSTTTIGGVGNVGVDLSNDHPISIPYASAGTGFHPTTNAVTGGGGDTVADMLFGGNVECSSCHDPHNAGNNGNFLRYSNTNSEVCLACHDK